MQMMVEMKMTILMTSAFKSFVHSFFRASDYLPGTPMMKIHPTRFVVLLQNFLLV